MAFPGSEANLESLVKTLQEYQKNQKPAERIALHFSRPAPHFKVRLLLFAPRLRA